MKPKMLMSASKNRTSSNGPRPTAPSPTQSGSIRVKESRFVQLEQATKDLSHSSIKTKDRTEPNALSAIQFGSIGVFLPQDHQGGAMSDSVGSAVKDLPALSPATFQDPAAPSQASINKNLAPSASVILQLTSTSTLTDPNPKADALGLPEAARKNIFIQNVVAPSFKVPLPSPEVHLETTMQLAYCSQLLRAHLSHSLAVASITVGLDPFQQASVDALLQDKEEQNKVRELAIRVVEEFVSDSLKTSEDIAEVILLGPYLDQEYYRKLLNSFIGEFEAAKLLDVDLLQGLVRLVQCAGTDYLQPDDLLRILAVLRIRLKDTHEHTTKHPYYLTISHSRLLDVMVEGKVRDLRRIVYHEPLSALLGQMMESADSYLKHQATYALRGLLHVPNDETHRQFVLQHAGNIAMGLLGVASVCKLDFGGVSDGAGKLQDATVSALDIGSKVVGGAQSIYERDQGIATSVKGGIFSGGRLLWYAALREAREHIHNGQLSDFNRLVFEAPCSQEAEFQWGVCMLLEEIAVDPQWASAIRQHSVDFLAELYKNDTTQSANKEIDQWILVILRQVVASPDSSVSSHAQLLLEGLEKNGGIDKQALCHVAMNGPVSPYPLRAHSPVPSSSSLLVRALDVLDVEDDLHRLRSQRLDEQENALYIPPQAKPTLQSSDDTLFLLMEKAHEFLAGSGLVLLLLGDSGGGKSTFNLQLERTLWKDYKRGSLIPLYINLPTIDTPSQDLIAKQLRYHNFSEKQIQDMKLNRQFIAICDGYDESQLRTNLHSTNQFNQPGQWKVKVLISCRSQYLASDYRSRFQPQSNNYYVRAEPELMLEAVIAPFSKELIERYVGQYVKNLPAHQTVQGHPVWTYEEYMEKLTKIPKLMELVSNPFLLTLSLEALPDIVDSKKDLSALRITRVQLYDGFVKHWLDVNKARLENSTLSDSERYAFDLILDDDFHHHGIQFQKDLAVAIFKEQSGNPLVSYTHLHDSKSWKSLFFGPDAFTKLLRESSVIARSGNFFRFLHRSLQEYFYSRTFYEPLDYDTDALSDDRTLTVDPKVALSQQSIIEEASVLQFLAERVGMDILFKKKLLDTVEDSKTDGQASQAAANSISILVLAGVWYNGADLRGIRIPGADIQGGQFDSADMEGADLSNVDMSKAWLRQANFSGSQMGGVQFGELPYLAVGEEEVVKCVFSSDGALLAVSTLDSKINVYTTTTWATIAEFTGGFAIAISPTTRELAKEGHNYDVEVGDILTGETRLSLKGHSNGVMHIAYSLDGSLIATASHDTTVRVWSTESGNTFHVLRDHTASVYGVAFSPCGLHLVSCSKDKTLRTWDAKTGELLLLLEKHNFTVPSVSYSSDGHQIASSDFERKIILWDAHTGAPMCDLTGHMRSVYCVAYSPDGHQLASCGDDATIYLWEDGEPIGTLSGHAQGVICLSYSPKGDYIASGSYDGTVRLWEVGRPLPSATSDLTMGGSLFVDISPDGLNTIIGNPDGSVQLRETRTGKAGLILPGHPDDTHQVVFSPCGGRIATVNWKGTIRLWCARTGEVIHCFESHKLAFLTFAFSPNGRQIATAYEDNTVRLWNAETGEPGLILKGHTDYIDGLGYSPSGDQIASCSEGKTVRLWCLLTGEQVKILHHQDAVCQLAFSPYGQELASLLFNGELLCFWDSQSGERIGQLPSEGNSIVICFSFSPCGKLVATGSEDGILRLWGRTLGNWSEVFRSSTGLTCDIRWRQGSKGRKYLATTSIGSVSVWELSESGGSCKLRMLWRLGKNELSMAAANMCGVVGLSAADLVLVKQRGAITEPECENEE